MGERFVVVLAVVTANVLLVVIFPALASVAVPLMAFLLVTCMFLVVVMALPRPRSLAVLSPAGIALGYLALSCGLVPLLWAMGLVKPWAEVIGAPSKAAAVAGLAFLLFAAGIALGWSPREGRRVVLETRSSRLTRTLVVGLAISLAGYLTLAALAGGPVALLYTLADRREVLSGTGPLRSLLVVAAIACVYGVMHVSKSRSQIVLTWLCGIAYFGGTLMTGARMSALTLLIALVVAFARSREAARRLWVTVGLLTAAVIPFSTYYGLKVRTGLTYDLDVQVLDDSSTTAAVGSLLSPFVRGGLDTIRTTHVVTDSVPAFQFDLGLLLGSLGNLVPRALWPGKPPGSATQFSAEYFPQHWQVGTGVPPSLTAEVMHSCGYVGGLFLLPVLGFVLARLSGRLMNSTKLFWVMIGPLLSADVILLAKGGSDGFLRTALIHVVAVVILIGVIGRGTQVRVVPVPGVGDGPALARPFRAAASYPSGDRKTPVADEPFT